MDRTNVAVGRYFVRQLIVTSGEDRSMMQLTLGSRMVNVKVKGSFLSDHQQLNTVLTDDPSTTTDIHSDVNYPTNSRNPKPKANTFLHLCT